MGIHIHAVYEVTIKRSIGVVWGWFCHPGTSLKWPEIIASHNYFSARFRFEGERAAGVAADSIVVVERLVGWEPEIKKLMKGHIQTNRITVKITEFNPLHRISFLVDEENSMLKTHIKVFDLSSHGEGTLVSLRVEQEFGPGLIDFYLDPQQLLEKSIEKDLSELRSLLEATH